MRAACSRYICVSFFFGALQNKGPLRQQFFGNISSRGIAQMEISAPFGLTTRRNIKFPLSATGDAGQNLTKSGAFRPPRNIQCAQQVRAKFALRVFRGPLKNKGPLRPQFFGDLSSRGISKMGIVGVAAWAAPSV